MTSLRKTAPARPAMIAAATHGYDAASLRLRRAANDNRASAGRRHQADDPGPGDEGEVPLPPGDGTVVVGGPAQPLGRGVAVGGCRDRGRAGGGGLAQARHGRIVLVRPG